MRKPILSKERNCAFLEPTTRAGLFVDGASYYRAFHRAAQAAEKQIFMMGWQFDSAVALVRGDDVRDGGAPVELLAFLEWLCARKPELRIHILAWDHSVVFALEREWRQEHVFNVSSERLTFRFDDSLARGASLHQKLVVIDGRLAFTGGMDICDARWDERDHRSGNALRVNLSGDPVGPYHDLQMFCEGRAAERMGDLFCERWAFSTGEAIEPERSVPLPVLDLGETMPLTPDLIAIARTIGEMVDPPVPLVEEIRALYVDAIASAEELIYIETQYLTSRSICDALVSRMEEASRSKLQIIILLPKRAEALKEEIALGVKQTERLFRLKEVSILTEHALGVYYTVASGGETEIATYIHSKLLIVDDLFITVGSANCTNRSLCFDNELNMAWESASPGDHVAANIRAVRTTLLSEHCGEPSATDLDEAAKLVERLDLFAERRLGRLRIHPLESTSIGEGDLLHLIAEQDWGLDPDLGAREPGGTTVGSS